MSDKRKATRCGEFDCARIELEAQLERAREENELNRAELDEINDLRDELGRAQDTLRYLRTQARNGTLHPQVVIQNVDKLLAPPHPDGGSDA